MVDWGGLENRCAREGTVGSNPTLSAILPPNARQSLRAIPSADSMIDEGTCRNAGHHFSAMAAFC